MMISIILSAAALNSSLSLTCPTGSKRTNWIAVIATTRCSDSRSAYCQFFDPNGVGCLSRNKVSMSACKSMISINFLYIPAGTSNSDRDMYVFMTAATWPDEIKAMGSGYTGTDTPSKGELPSFNVGYSDKHAYKYWHFIDTPFSTDGTALPQVSLLNSAQKIAVFRQALATSEPDLLKSYDLVWLLHLVGDIHQPLHCATRVTKAKPLGDLGGNLVVINGPAKELHAFWDDAVGLGETQNFMTAVT